MKIAGLMKLTLLDFPEKTACTVFTPGCNFRCPYCHNSGLVETGAPRGEISESDFFEFLKSRQGKLDGVAITGGEPLMHADLADFAAEVRRMGFLVKLDTNGSYPDRLEAFISRGLADYIAMDIKAAPENYAKAAGVAAPIDKIKESVGLVMNSRVPYEFRTTAAKGAVSPDDFEKIGAWLSGCKNYYIQNFVDSGSLLTQNCNGYTPDEMNGFLNTVRKYIPGAELRGL